MPDIPDMQWCFPFRRGHAGASFPVSAMAIGATKLHAITEITRLATILRIVFRERQHVTAPCDKHAQQRADILFC